MNIEIKPGLLSGTVNVPPSKSVSHRALICAALAGGKSVVKNLLRCADTEATMSVMTALGARFEPRGNDMLVTGIENAPELADADCGESGSTLRFLVPVAAALGVSCTFSGKGRLPERPITPYFTELKKNGIIFDGNTMPYKINGQLKSGVYSLSGDISSQFVSGLMFALPLLPGDSEIILTSPLQSKPYADMTAAILKSFGVNVNETESGYFIPGGQKYLPRETEIEGDLSQAAFFLVADCLGSKVKIGNLSNSGLQGDSEIIALAERFSGSAFNVDARQIPDLVPILTVLACFADGTSVISGCERLRIKESDRLEAVSTELNKLGAKIKAGADYLEINGVKTLHGGVCDSRNDHRIAMALAIAATRASDNVIINGAQCVSKSYPNFFEDYKALGGKINVIDG